MTTRTMIKNILLNIGYSVDSVIDPTEALVKLKLNHYDLIITDINMPKINGYEFVEMLRQDEMYQDLPIIVVSSLPEEQVMSKMKNKHIELCIKKDMFNQTTFVDQVRAILAKYHV